MESLPSNIGKLYSNNSNDPVNRKKKGQISFAPSSFNANNNIQMANNNNNVNVSNDNSKVYEDMQFLYGQLNKVINIVIIFYLFINR